MSESRWGGRYPPKDEDVEDVAETVDAMLARNYGDVTHFKIAQVSREIGRTLAPEKVYGALYELSNSPRRGLDIEQANTETSSARTRWRARRLEGGR